MNKRIVPLMLLLVLGGLLFVAMLDETQAQSAGAGNIRVAVCDLPEVFTNALRMEDNKAWLRTHADKMQRIKTEQEREIEKLQAMFEEIAPDTPEYEAHSLKVLQAQNDLQARMQYESAVAQRERFRQTKTAYDEILETVRQVARSEGFDLVLAREGEKIDAQNARDLVAMIAGRKVIYHNNKVDITEKVLTKLNADYKAQLKKPN